MIARLVGVSNLPRVVGLDLSLTSTGIAVVREGVLLTRAIGSAGKADATLADRQLRLARLAEQVNTLIVQTDPDLTVIESPAFSRTTGHQHDRSGLWWLIVHRLRQQKRRVLEVQPNLRGKYATGSGNANKAAVVIAVTRRYPEVTFKTDDEADALVLAAIGCRLLGHPLEDGLPAKHLEALATLKLPPESS